MYVLVLSLWCYVDTYGVEREREREIVEELPDDDTTKQHFLIYIEFSVHVNTMTRRDEQTV